MTNKEPTPPPDSFESLCKRLFAFLAGKSMTMPKWLWLPAGLLLILVFVGLARMGVLGEPWLRISKNLIGVEIPLIDEAETLVPLTLQMHRRDTNGAKRIFDDDAVESGARVELEVVVGKKAWLTVFCVDRNGFQYVFNGQLNPSLVEKETYHLSFELDDTRGSEVYFAVASSKPFSFEKEIAPALNKLFPRDPTPKGPKPERFYLALPKSFTQKSIAFNHIPKTTPESP